MPKVAVIGGSIAGLTIANLLRDCGCEVDVYERSVRPLSGFGTGIVVQPELVRYLTERAGIPVEEISVGSGKMRYISASTAESLGEIPSAWRFTAYNAIYGCLLRKFGLDRYHMGRTLIDIADTGLHAVATFEDGQRVVADLIVCADGGRSISRQKLLGITPSYAGYVTWRGMVAQSEVHASTWGYFQDAFTYGLLDDSHTITYPVPEVTQDGYVRPGVRLNWQWYWNLLETDLGSLMTDAAGVVHPVSLHSELLPAATLARFRGRAAEELSRPFAELIHGATKPFVTLVADAAVPKMAFEHVALIGDAAFTPRPHAAAGAAKACSDAWSLADHLVATAGNVKAALNAWEPQQIGIGQAYLAKASRMGGVLQHGGDFPPGALENAFGLPRPASDLLAEDIP